MAILKLNSILQMLCIQYETDGLFTCDISCTFPLQKLISNDEHAELIFYIKENIDMLYI